VSEQIRPFTLSVPEEQLTDLRDRLSRVRWPERETVPDGGQGLPLAKIQALSDYWRTGYDWRAAEKNLNGFGQFTTTIDGLDIHFLHVRSPEPDALPLVMTHGWPGSVLEFRKVIGPLTNPAAHGGDPRHAFHLVIPSLPGFGFSGKPTESGWGYPHIADAWITLMDRLGYRRWGAQGGDLGAAVTDEIGHKAPPGCVGLHLNFTMIQPTSEEIADATPDEKAMLERAATFWERKTSYLGMQSNSPQTVGYSLADSPTGLAAWIYALVQDICETPGNAEASLSLDEIIDGIMLYWLPNTGTSAARMYWEMMQTGWWPPATIDDPITVPTGFSMFPAEPMRKSRRWVERRYSNVIHFNEPDKGGHFAALEQPGLFVDEIRESFSTLR
jgi:pimeloyl-ACP methyl ester carboxylesterase